MPPNLPVQDADGNTAALHSLPASPRRPLAALARAVANCPGRPVAGVVSGCGVADVLTEAVGGRFVLGAANAIRDGAARALRLLGLGEEVIEPAHAQRASLRAPERAEPRSLESFTPGSADSTALLALLLARGERLNLPVGHSKGNCSIENALEGCVALCRRTGRKVPSHLNIVTFGAVVYFSQRAVSRDLRKAATSLYWSFLFENST